MNVLLAIKPKWAALIYKGEKIIEFRKSMPKKFDFENDIVFLYETSPICKVTGYIKLLDCHEINKRYLNAMKENNLFSYRYFQDRGKVNFDELLKYAGKKNIFAWTISDFYQIPRDTINKFTASEKPPQSWCYTRAYFCNGTFNFDHQIKYGGKNDGKF